MIISDIIEPIIQDIIEPINGSEDVFALILDGAPAYDTTVTKVGDSFGSGPTGDIITFGTNEAAHTYINGQKVFLQYAGVQKCEIDGIPTDSTNGIVKDGTKVLDPVIIESGAEKLYCLELNELVTDRIASIDGLTGNVNAHSWKLECYAEGIVLGQLSVYVNSADVNVYKVPINTIGDLMQTNVIPSSTTRKISFFSNQAPIGSKLYFRLTQLTETSHQLPTIVSSKDGPVTVNASIQSLLVEDVGAEKAVLPWYSDVGTPFGLKGLFGGVDGNLAFGQGGIITHTVYDLSIDIVLGMFELNSFIVWWIEAITGFIKMTDGVNTCVSDTAVVAGTPFTAYPRWDGVNAKMWITKDDSKGLEEQFDGFPAMGDRFFGIIDIYQTNRQFSFNQQIDFAYVYDGDDLVIDAGLPVIDYL